jgi:hypothetical protein
MTRDAYDATVLGIMTNPSGAKHGGVKVHIFPDLKHDYVHSKYLIVEGKYNNKADARVVWTGSHNFTKTALRTFDETTLQLFAGGRLEPAYIANFKRVAAAAPCTRQMGRTTCLNRSAARMVLNPQDDTPAVILEQD